jgi:hypothetical protein
MLSFLFYLIRHWLGKRTIDGKLPLHCVRLHLAPGEAFGILVEVVVAILDLSALAMMLTQNVMQNGTTYRKTRVPSNGTRKLGIQHLLVTRTTAKPLLPDQLAKSLFVVVGIVADNVAFFVVGVELHGQLRVH